jgi:hypothetical protein
MPPGRPSPGGSPPDGAPTTVSRDRNTAWIGALGVLRELEALTR